MKLKILVAGTVFSLLCSTSIVSATAVDFNFLGYVPTNDQRVSQALQTATSAYSMTFLKNPINPADIKFSTYEYDTATSSYIQVNYGYSYTTFPNPPNTVPLYTTQQTALVGDILGDSIGSVAVTSGGAIYSNQTRNSIIGDFVGNSSGADGGALFTISRIVDKVIGNFIGNSASARGGALFNYNGGVINTLTSNFINNTSVGLGGALGNDNAGTLGNVSGYFIANKSNASGGAIANWGKIGNISAVFINNSATYGGAIINQKGNTYVDSIGNISGYFIKNSAILDGGAIYNMVNNSGATKIDNITADFISNNSNRNGGAVYLSGNANYTSTITFTNSNFIKNTAASNGGAIYGTLNSVINIVADNGTSLFQDNTANGLSNAIFASTNRSTINLNSINNGIIQFDDAITGTVGYTFNIDGDDSSKIVFNNNISNGNINYGATSSSNFTTTFADTTYLNNNNSLTISGGALSILTLGATDNLHFRDFNPISGKISIKNADVDLTSQTMGIITANNYTSGSTIISVDGFNILTDELNTTNVFFANSSFANQVVSGINKANGPVYKYSVAYDALSGDFIFTNRGFNTSVYSPTISAVTTASVLSDEIYTRVLSDVDSLHNYESPVVCSRRTGKAFVKVFDSHDSIDIKNSEGVDSQYYGVIGGVESHRINEGKGVSAIYNSYLAYAHGKSKFSEDRIDQDSFYIGVSANFYKSNFFVGTTASAGFIKNKTDDREGFNSYTAGAAAKLGYNYKLSKNVLLQPNIYGSYTYINSENYTTSLGAKVKFGGLHNFEVAPGAKLSKNFTSDAKIYLQTRYVFIFNEGQNATANGLSLPNVNVEDFVEYGVGAEKLWKDSAASAFAQVYRRDLGREGWNFTIGLKKNF